MINKIIQFSIKNKFAIGLFTIALIFYGSYSLTKLPIDAVPDITNNQVQVITLSPTLATQEVEQFITTPMEITMATLPDLVEIRSMSRYGLSVITIVFKDNVDKYLARQLVGERMKEAETQIPQGMGSPELAPITTGLGEIYHYVVTTKPGYEKKYSAMDLRTIQDWIVRRQLLGTVGVADVSGWGGELKQYEISIDPYKLNSMKISFAEIFSALKNNNENTGGAYIEKSSNLYLIRGMGLVNSLDDIKKIIVKNINNIPVLISDIAQVQYGSAIRYGAVTRNGEGEVVGGLVLMLKDENTSEVIHNVKIKMQQIQKSLPEGVVVEPYIDRSELVNRAIGTVERNLLEGALIVIFILVLFLGNFRAGLIVASVIPLSMLFAVIMMNLFGVTGNLMSLGAIDFGLIVDGAVIIVEAVLHTILHSRYHEKGILKLNNEQMNHEVRQSATQMMNSATFGQIIILIVYIPILTLVGIEGKMFRPMAMTVSFAIIGALLLSLTYVPMMSALFLPKKTTQRANISHRMMELFQRWYHPAIEYAMRKKFIVISTAALFFIGSLILFNTLGGEFIPTLEEGDLNIEYRLMPGTSLTQTIEACSRIEKALRERLPEVKQVVSRIGTAEIATDPMPIEGGDIMIIMKDKSQWTSASTRGQMMEIVEQTINEVVPGSSFEISQPIQMRFNELIAGIRQDVAVKIYGENLDTLRIKANEIAKIIAPVRGVETPLIEPTAGLPQITVEYDRNRIAQYGLTISDVNEVLKAAFGGDVAGVVFEGEKKFDMVIRLSHDYRKDIDDVKSLYISLPSGSQIPMSQVADIEYKEGPAQISHEDAERRTYVGFNIKGRDIASTVEEIQQKLDKELKLPPGYYITYGGQFQNLKEAQKRLSIAVPVALLLIFVLLFFTFSSFREALLIYTAIPMSAIGGVVALWVRGMPFSISAGVGFIALFGVAVLNGIVLISTFNQLEKEGVQDIFERVRRGTRIRLRPVLMTASVASLGFLPMAISTTAGAEVQRPLATVVIGGLITATALTLIVLPALYILFSRKRKTKTIAISAVLIGLLFSGTKQSQAQTVQSPVVISLDSAVSIAMKNNPRLIASQLNVTANKKLQKTSFDFGKTGLFYENEDLRSDMPDDKGIKKIGFSQSFEFPTTYIAQSKVNRQNTAIAQSNLSLTEKELLQNVRSAYFNLWFTVSKQNLLKQQDSIFTDYENAATLRFTSGETNKLEMISAQAKHKEIQLDLQAANADVVIAQNEMMKWLNINYAVIPENISMQKLQSVILNSQSTITNHPYLQLSQEKITLANYQRKVEVNKLLLDLNIRYFNQNWYGVSDGYYGYSFGVGIPLLFWAQQGRIQSAKLQQQIAQKNFENDQLIFNTAYSQVLQEFQKNNSLLSYYEQTGLQQADEILSSATLAYKNGEIGYVEFTTLLSQSIDIKNKYLASLNNYNQSVIKLNYFLNQ